MSETNTPSTTHSYEIRAAVAPFNPTQASPIAKAPLTFGSKYMFTPSSALSPSGQRTWGEPIDKQNETMTDLLDQREQQLKDMRSNMRRSSIHDRKQAENELTNKIMGGVRKSNAITEKSMNDHESYHLAHSPKYETAKTNDPAIELRRAARRESIKKIDPTLLLHRLTTAAKLGTPDSKELLDTVFTDPALPEHQMISPDDAATLKDAWLRAHHGDSHYQSLADIRQARAILHANQGIALSVLHRNDANQEARLAQYATATAHTGDGPVANAIDPIKQLASGRALDTASNNG